MFTECVRAVSPILLRPETGRHVSGRSLRDGLGYLHSLSVQQLSCRQFGQLHLRQRACASLMGLLRLLSTGSIGLHARQKRAGPSHLVHPDRLPSRSPKAPRAHGATPSQARQQAKEASSARHRSRPAPDRPLRSWLLGMHGHVGQRAGVHVSFPSRLAIDTAGQCLDLSSTTTSCGSCSNDCTKLVGAESASVRHSCAGPFDLAPSRVQCQSGLCIVTRCRAGWRLKKAADGRASCQLKVAKRKPARML
jgi:hypothetical protein